MDSQPAVNGDGSSSPALPGPQHAATPPPAARRWRRRRHGSAWRALRHRSFRYYFAGSLISNLGTWFQNTAQALLAYQLTHSVLAVGIVTCAQFSGSLLLGPWAAVVAHHVGGKRMLTWMQFLSAAIAAAMAGLQAAGQLREQFLVAGALGLGLAFTFTLPVQTATVPLLVPEAATEAAMAMNSVSYNAGRALAPALCVWMISATGYTGAFALNALSFVVFGVMLLATGPRATPPPSPGAPDNPPRALDGLSVALRTPRIALLLAMVAAVTFADDPVLILGPALAHHLPGATHDFPGYFLSALGGGTILGSLRPTMDPQQWNASRTARRAARSLLFLVLMMVLFVYSRNALLSLAAAFLAGAAALRTGAATQTGLVRQRPADAASVMAIWAIAWAGTKPLASLADGWVASTHGVHWAVFTVTALALVVGAAELTLPEACRKRLRAAARVAGNWLDTGLHAALVRLRTVLVSLTLPPGATPGASGATVPIDTALHSRESRIFVVPAGQAGNNPTDRRELSSTSQ